MLARAGAAHNIDADLLASVVQAGAPARPFALSRAGAQGLMQLMPSTASQRTCTTASSRGEHRRRHCPSSTNSSPATIPTTTPVASPSLVAAYAGLAWRVDNRYHGLTPYAETRAYVARVIREFNRRKRAAGTTLVILTSWINVRGKRLHRCGPK